MLRPAVPDGCELAYISPTIWGAAATGAAQTTTTVQKQSGVVDSRLRLEHCPGEPEVIAVDHRGQTLAGQRPGRRRTEDVPRTAGLRISNSDSTRLERQDLSFQRALKDTGGPYVTRVWDAAAVERRRDALGEQDDDGPAAGGVVDHTDLFHHAERIWNIFAVQRDCDHALHRRQATALRPAVQER